MKHSWLLILHKMHIKCYGSMNGVLTEYLQNTIVKNLCTGLWIVEYLLLKTQQLHHHQLIKIFGLQVLVGHGFQFFSADVFDGVYGVVEEAIIQSVQDQQLIFSLWREGDYTSNFVNMQFLQQTNYLLQMHGQKMIEEDFLELILD